MFEERKWVLDDKSRSLYAKHIVDRLYRVVGIRTRDPNDVLAQEGEVDLNPIPDDYAEMILNRYGQPALEEFRKQNGDAADRLLAGYLFWERMGETLGSKEFPNKEAASEFLQLYTKDNLDEGAGYKDEDRYKQSLHAPCYTRDLFESIEDCFTRYDFIRFCGGDALKAEMVFSICDWTHPTTKLDEWDEEDEEALREERAKQVAVSSYYGHYILTREGETDIRSNKQLMENLNITEGAFHVALGRVKPGYKVCYLKDGAPYLLIDSEEVAQQIVLELKKVAGILMQHELDCTWTCFGTMSSLASCYDDACAEAMGPKAGLPSNGAYISESFAIAEHNTEHLLTCSCGAERLARDCVTKAWCGRCGGEMTPE